MRLLYEGGWKDLDKITEVTEDAQKMVTSDPYPSFSPSLSPSPSLLFPPLKSWKPWRMLTHRHYLCIFLNSSSLFLLAPLFCLRPICFSSVLPCAVPSSLPPLPSSISSPLSPLPPPLSPLRSHPLPSHPSPLPLPLLHMSS